MKPLVLDTETTTSNKGNPFDTSNKLCYVGLKSYIPYDRNLYDIEYSVNPYRKNLEEIQSVINDHDIIVGFNLKFDLHWIRFYGIDFSSKRVWDCQLVHFIITNQTHPYPSLNEVAEYYGLTPKLDVVAKEYWDNSIDTVDIPREILEEYLQGDLNLTEQVFLKQREYLQSNSGLVRLCSLHNQDLLVLQEMEFNGLIYDNEKAKKLAVDTRQQINSYDGLLYVYHNLAEFNLNSSDHLSALLYGGEIKLRKKEPNGFYKTGARAGEAKEKWVDYTVKYPRLFTPIKGSELAKVGLYSTDEPTLKSLRGNKNGKELIQLLLKRAELEKRVSTYYEGLTNLQIKNKWEEGKLHGQFNQCVARTGRLSSSKPNLQNIDGKIKELFGTRFA